MSINVGEGEDFEFNVEEAKKWSDEDAQRVVDFLFARGGDVEGSDQNNLIQQINENRGSDVTPSGESDGEVDATDAAVAKAEELGVDLDTVEGTGAGGRITVGDVEAAAGE